MSALTMLAAACIAVAAALAARAIVPPTPRLAPRVRPYVVAGRSRLGHAALPVDGAPLPSVLGGPFGRLFGPPLSALARRAGRLVESRTDGHLELRLAQAGLVDVSVEEHRVRQVTQGAGAAIVGGAVAAIVLRTPVTTLAVALGAGFWGVTRARAAVDRLIAERAERIRLELPTIAQLLALHVRAGAGPMQAVQRVVARGHGVVVDDLDRALRHARTGGREADAFRAIAAATPEPSAARTYELFAIAVERGADLAEGLLALGSQLREARREEVRKQAVKRRAAMLLPTIGILAPIMLLFIAAPLPSIVLGRH
jgi:tight adherence protein C